MPTHRSWPEAAQLMLRVGLGLVLMSFGAEKVLNPEAWLIFVPQWIVGARLATDLNVLDLLRFQGTVEALLGAQLILGLMTRLAAVTSSLLLGGIVLLVGWTPIGVRDFGLMTTAVTMALLGPGRWSVDHLLALRRPDWLPASSLLTAWGGCLVLSFSIFVVFGANAAEASSYEEWVPARYASLPIPPLPQRVSVDPDMVGLGRTLFNDPTLSRDRTIACSTCHSSRFAGADGRTVSLGMSGELARRNSPTVYNSAYNFSQFWDGRAATLEEQVDHPLTNDAEMGIAWSELLARLEAEPRYVHLFERAFDNGITADNVRSAIAEFERSLITPNAPFDRWVRKEAEASLPASAERGYGLFRSLGCISCHHGVNVGGGMYQTVGRLRPFFDPDDDADLGRFEVTGDPRDRHRFKVPSLRNVALTAPYFHDGSVPTLDDAVRTMARYQLGYDLADHEVSDIVAFLESLTGELPEI